MTNINVTTHSIRAEGNHEIPIYLWEPDGMPTAVIQVFHGLGEHSARYARFAETAVAQGYAVCAHDHRGHGPNAEDLGFFAPENSWQLLVTDGHRVSEFLREKFPDRPVVLLGHSMGSYIAQSYAMRFGNELVALILSGSTWPARLQLMIGRLLARFEAWRHGRRGSSALLDKQGFGAFNKKFEPARTELDWLSREHSEVDAYIDDPLCGGPYSTGLWIDLLGGLLAISTNAALRQISTDLPILITGGADDPVGGENGMRKLADRYLATGHNKLTTKIYPGGRHEMLNETNRDEFTNDLLAWIAASLLRHQA
ncbi:MAG: alpha/beta hydrolase [Gammaproteobacteria bacterium]|nr:alpha/beta hydrolase [Gammaproteobacteria bacterium]MBU2677532.1 alpha/beta hydrolase [Gammaproteobacteria bacterium]NNL51264.1 alpha/beta hydrolase [Woeseiaceae bacterium]